MKIKTYLNKLNKTDIVSIGTRSGSGYMYIGEACNVDQIILEIERYRDRISRELIELEGDIALLAREDPANIGMDAYEYAASMANILDGIKRRRKYLKNYVDVLKRDVCEVEDRLAEEGVRVIITGSERGSFWVKSEYDEHRG